MNSLLSAWVASFGFAAALGAICVYCYGKISPQKLIRKTKQNIWGVLYEAVLFQRESSLSFKAYARLLKLGSFYMLLALGPLVVLLLPSLYLMDFGYQLWGRSGLKLGQAVVIEAQLPSTNLQSKFGLEGIALPQVRDLENKQIFSRVLPDFERAAIVDLNGTKQQLQFGESTPALKFGEFTVPYPELQLSIFGVKLGWTSVVIIVMLASGFIFARVMRIEV